VEDCYAPSGRPSVDPRVFFRLQLVMFFEGVRSERELMRITADRLSVRWYLGYDLHEALPNHSSLTRIRERYGLEVFRRFFERVVEECLEAGLVWGEELYFDATRWMPTPRSTPSLPASPWRGIWTASLRMTSLPPPSPTRSSRALMTRVRAWANLHPKIRAHEGRGARRTGQPRAFAHSTRYAGSGRGGASA
jgi:hypothetical protein